MRITKKEEMVRAKFRAVLPLSEQYDTAKRHASTKVNFATDFWWLDV